MKIGEYESHPAADWFPMMEGEEFDSLVADIASNGLKHPIVRFNRQILDGRNRLKACLKAKVKPEFVALDSDQDPVAYVVSANIKRRHLDESQRGWIAAKIATAQSGDRNDLTPIGARSVTKAGASALFKVGTGTIDRARAVQKTAVPEVGRAVERGALPLGPAAAIAKREPEAQRAIVKRINDGAKPADAIREHERSIKREQLESVATKTAKAASGVYDVLVIDPPWPMEKIERDERPNQGEFDYPTMSEADMAALKIPAADDCHAWVWTTHKFLPMAFRLLDVWGLKYVCTFVWHKPGGFQPIGLPQYNCEFALYCRRGAPVFLDTKALPVCFEAPRGKHSEKPEAFYDVVRRVTAGRRLDMFNRREIVGFDRWGNEADK